MRRVPVESSNVAEVGYEDGTLQIAFRDRKGNPTGIYDFENVPKATYHALMEAPSKGCYFAQFIRGHYPYVKVT